MNIRHTDTPSMYALDAKADDAAGEHVHDQHHPMAAQEDRFAAEQVDAPEAVLGLRDERQPGRAIGTRVLGPVVLRKHAANDILVDLDAEGMRDLLGDAQVAELGIAGLHLDDRRDDFQRWPFRAGLASLWLRKRTAGGTSDRPRPCGT